MWLRHWRTVTETHWNLVGIENCLSRARERKTGLDVSSSGCLSCNAGVKTAKHHHCFANRMRLIEPSVPNSSFFMGSSLSENVLKCRLVFPLISALIPFCSSLRRLAIPFCSRVWILRSPLAIFLLCLEFKFCFSTLIHQVPSHLCHSSHHLRASRQRSLHPCVSHQSPSSLPSCGTSIGSILQVS